MLKPLPLAITRWMGAHNFTLEDVKGFSMLVDYDAYTIDFNDGTFVRVSGPVLMRYED